MEGSSSMISLIVAELIIITIVVVLSYLFILFIDWVCEELLILYIKHNPTLINSLYKFQPEVIDRTQLAVVKVKPSAILWIVNPSEKIQLAAVRQNPCSIMCIYNPSNKVKEIVMDYDPRLINLWINPTNMTLEERDF